MFFLESWQFSHKLPPPSPLHTCTMSCETNFLKQLANNVSICINTIICSEMMKVHLKTSNIFHSSSFDVSLSIFCNPYVHFL